MNVCSDSQRPENFIDGYHLASIKNEGKIYTGAGDGRKPFIAAQDIAQVARCALIDENPHNKDHYITGPESLTYDEVGTPDYHSQSPISDPLAFKTYASWTGRRNAHGSSRKENRAY